MKQNIHLEKNQGCDLFLSVRKLIGLCEMDVHEVQGLDNETWWTIFTNFIFELLFIKYFNPHNIMGDIS